MLILGQGLFRIWKYSRYRSNRLRFREGSGCQGLTDHSRVFGNINTRVSNYDVNSILDDDVALTENASYLSNLGSL